MFRRVIKVAVSGMVWLADRLMHAGRRLAGRPARVRGVVLYYHSVRPELRRAFGRQMDLLLDCAQPWRLDAPEMVEDRSPVAVTFDDGYASVVENALPELCNRGIPFTIFFPTGSWDSRPSWVKDPTHPFFDERVLSREELVALAREPLVIIGSHSISHPNFCRLDRDAAGREFVDSKRELEELLHTEVTLFSFPHGAYTLELVQQARDSGYQKVFTIEPEQVNPMAPSLTIGRVATEPDDWLIEFRLKLAGAYRWQTWLKRHSSAT